MTGTRTRLAGFVLLALATLSGCGGLHPNIAAQAGDQSISDAEVDQLAQDLCTTVKSQAEAMGYARSALLQTVVQSFVMRAMADQMADEYGVTSTAAYDGQVEQAKTQLAKSDPDVLARVLDTYTATQYFIDILTSIGAQQLEASGTTKPSPNESLVKGIDLAQEWEADNEIQIDPLIPRHHPRGRQLHPH